MRYKSYKEYNETVHAMIADYIRRHPELTYREMAKATGISHPTFARVAKAHGLSRRIGNRLRISEQSLWLLENSVTEIDQYLWAHVFGSPIVEKKD